MSMCIASGPSPIESIRLVRRYEHLAPQLNAVAVSLPGHLIHLVLEGEVEVTSNGRRHLLTPGCVLWYHENEWVESRVRQAPWKYYSVNFSAPTLAPPEFDSRLIPHQLALKNTFAALHQSWQQPASQHRDLQCQAHLLQLLTAIAPQTTASPSTTTHGRLWWEVETWARQHIDRAISLSDLCSQFNRSANTLARACHEAVGLPPLKRLKQIRLSLARGLVHYSELTMTEIAARVGYARVHEFSRDYRKHHGLPPTHDRRTF